MIVVGPSVKKELSRISCSKCGARVRGIGLAKDSLVKGLYFKCKECGKYNKVVATKNENK